MKQLALITPGNILFIVFIFMIMAIIINSLVASILVVAFIFAWWYSLAFTLNKSTQNMRVNFKLFEICYITSIISFVISLFIGSTHKLDSNVAVIQIFIFIVMIINIIIQIFIISKLMSSGRSEVLLTRIQLFYLPIGIWWLYPKYKKLIDELEVK